MLQNTHAPLRKLSQDFLVIPEQPQQIDRYFHFGVFNPLRTEGGAAPLKL